MNPTKTAKPIKHTPDRTKVTSSPTVKPLSFWVKFLKIVKVKLDVGASDQGKDVSVVGKQLAAASN